MTFRCRLRRRRRNGGTCGVGGWRTRRWLRWEGEASREERATLERGNHSETEVEVMRIRWWKTGRRRAEGGL
jgi:hypothetical protein